MTNRRKKIAIDATALPKKPVGAGRYIINLVRELLFLETDFDFRIIAHEDDFELFGLDPKFKEKFLFIPDHGRGFRILWEQIGFPILLKREKIDLVHGLHYSRPIFSPCPVVTTIMDMTFFYMPERHILIKRFFFRFFIRFSSRFSKTVLSISESTKNDLLKTLNVNPEKIYVSPCGVNAAYTLIEQNHSFDLVREKYHLPEKFGLFVGLIEPRKNVPLLIEAFSEALKMEGEGENNLVIAGRWGWGSEEIKNQIDTLGIKERIFFPGYIDEEDLPILMNMAKYFVYPSIYEGFGLPVLEAMACGTPVITTNVSSMPEFVGDTGVLLEPNDKKALVEAILNMIKNPQHKSMEAYQRASQYTWKNTAITSLAAYKAALEIGD